MSTLTGPRRRLGLTLTCAGVLAFGVAACGESGSGGDADPADAVPASAPLYAEIAVKPDGELKTDTDAALGKILGTDDVAAEIEKLIKSGDAPSDEEYEDVVGSLGERVGFFLTSFEGGSGDGAAVFGLSDTDVKLDTEGREKRSYKDVDYWVDADGDARGIVGDYLVSGTERGLRTVVDTVEGDDVDTMGDNATYQDGLDQLTGEDPLASAYISVEGFVNALGRSGGLPAAALGQLRQQLAQVSGSSVVLAATANGEQVAIDALAQGVKQPANQAGGNPTAALEALPADAWAAVGVGALGEQLQNTLDQALQLAAVGGQDVSGQIEAAEQALGVDIEQDLLSWMGDGGLFASGSTIGNVGGALVIETSDPAKTEQAIAKLRQLVPQFSPSAKVAGLSGVSGADAGFQLTDPSSPFPVIVALGGDRFVLGVGKAAVEAALSPSSTLADSPAYKAAAGTLDGVEPSMFVDIAAVSAFLKGLGLDSDPESAEVFKYLDRFTAVIAGTKRDGDTYRTRVVVTLK